MNKFRILLITGIFVFIILIIKVYVHLNLWEVFSANSLYTSLIAGGVFIVGVVLAGTLTDFKESERLPSDIVAALDNLYDEGVYVAKVKPKFNVAKLRTTLSVFIDTFHADLALGNFDKSQQKLDLVTDSFIEMEELGIPANYIVRLKSEVGSIKKSLLRIEQIQSTSFLPSAYVLLQSIAALIIFTLIFTDIGSFSGSLVATGIISYIFIYIIQLLHLIDKPFRKDMATMDDVSLFLVRKFHTHIKD